MMEFHTCKNCSLINQVIGDQVQKYDTLSEENISLHNALIKSRDAVTRLSLDLASVRDGLISERRRNLQLYMHQQTNNLQNKPLHISTHLESERSEDNKRKPTARTVALRSAAVPIKDEDNSVSLSKYKELVSVMERQKQMYETDLGLFQSLSDKCISKLKEQLCRMQEHACVILEMYEVLRNDLFAEKKENVEFRKLFQDSIDTLQSAHAKKVEEIRKKAMVKTTSVVNTRVKEALNMMKFQLEDRDRLVVRLRQQQATSEAHAEKRVQEHQKQQQEYKRIIDELRKHLKIAQEKYAILDKRRALEAEGFFTDVNKIRKDLKQLKNNRSVDYIDLENQRLERETDALNRKLRLCYFKQ